MLDSNRARLRNRAPLRDYRRLFHAIPDAVLVVRPDSPHFTIVAASNAYLDATFTQRSGARGIIGRGLFEVFPPAPHAAGAAGERVVRASLERTLETRWQQSIPDVEYPIRRPDGSWESRRWSAVNVPLFDERGIVDYVMHRVVDLSDQRSLDATTSAAEAAVAAAEAANEAKSRFLASISHELRTPLNAIGGYVDLITLGVHGPVTEDQRVALERIRRSEQHLLGLINQVLSYAKIESGHVQLRREQVLLHDVIEDLLALTAPQAKMKGVRLSAGPTLIDGCELDVFGDAEKIRQILLNLVSNAIKFTEPGGRVNVTCEDEHDQVVVSVHDSGVGIAPEELGRVFEPFVQLADRQNPQEGTGLGLPISRELARAMGGDVTVSSRPGDGSVFVLRLPRARRGKERRSA